MNITIQMVMNGEARHARQVVKVLNSDGKVVAYAKPQYPMVCPTELLLLCFGHSSIYFYMPDCNNVVLSDSIEAVKKQ